MNSQKLFTDVKKWIKAYQFCGIVRSHRLGDYNYVEFEAVTTKTRASTMVTRVGLIAQDIVAGSGRRVIVGKELMSAPPSTRADLATWKIYAKVLVGKQEGA